MQDNTGTARKTYEVQWQSVQVCNYTHIYGIDAGTKTGGVEYDVEESKYIWHYGNTSASSWEFMISERHIQAGVNVLVVLENPNLDKTNFVASTYAASMWNALPKTMNAQAKMRKIANAIAQRSLGSGIVRGMARKWVDFLEFNHIDFLQIAPSKRTSMGGDAKVKKKQLFNARDIYKQLKTDKQRLSYLKQLYMPTKLKQAEAVLLFGDAAKKGNEHAYDAATPVYELIGQKSRKNRFSL